MQGIPEYLTPKLLTKVSEFPPPSTITTNPLLNNGRTVLSFSQVPPNDNIKSQYSQLLREEFDLLIARLKKPEKNSRTSPLLYGKDFPFGTNQVIPEISRYTLFQDILKLHAASVSLHRTQRLKEEADPKVHMLSKVASCRWLIFVSAIADGLHEFDEEILLNPISDAFKNTSINNDISTRLSDKSREYMRSGKTINTDFATTKQLLSLLAKTAFNAGLTLENLLKEEQKAHRRSLGNFQSSLKNKKQVNNEKQYKIKILFSDTEGSYDKILQALKLRNIELISSTSCTLISGEVALSELVIKYTGDIAIEKKLEDFPDSDRLNGVKVFHASVDKKKKINDEKRYKINIFFSDNAGSYNKLLHFLADKQINLISSQSWTLVHGEVAKSELIISYDGDLEKLKAALEKIYSCDELCNIVCQFTVSIIDWEITN
jgi:ACT domain-containing protein